MPQSPEANSVQKEVLQDLVSLAQDEAVSTGNQVAVLTAQIEKFQNALVLFHERYTYWDNYIKTYEAERKLLDGVFTLNPVTGNDYNDFLNTRGRLYVSGSFTPNRIPQFDNVGFSPTGTEARNESGMLAREAQVRSYLQSNFLSPNPFPSVSGGFYRLNSAFTPTSTSVQFTTSTGASVSYPSGPGEVMIYSPSLPQGGVLVRYLVLRSFTIDGTAILEGLTFSKNFTTIPSGQRIETSGPAFNDTERTSGVAANSTFQSRLHAYIQAYAEQAQVWADLVQAELAEFINQQNAGEDSPDTAYIQSVQNLADDLDAFLSSLSASDAALSAMQGYNAARVSGIPNRIQYIDHRLIQQTKAYDGRYRYADRLYNLADGAYVLIQKLTAQRDQLINRQAESNYRAAQLSQEVF